MGLRRLSLRIRLAALATAGAMVVLSAGSVLLYEGLTRELSNAITDELAIRVVDLAAGTEGGAAPPGSPRVTAQVIDQSGEVLSPPDADPMIGTAELARASQEQIVVDREVPLVGENARVLARPITVNGADVVGVAATSTTALTVARNRLIVVLVIAGPLLAIGIGIGVWALTGVALRPVRRMASQAATISAAQVSRRLPQPAREDEIAELGRTLNGMLERIENAVARERAFIDDAAHELRTPIAVLRGELELAAHDPDDPQAVSQSLASALEETDRLSDLADGLLALARADAGQLRPGDATTDMLAAARTGVEHLPPRGEVAVEVHGEPAVVQADPEWVRHIVSNLVGNAQRHATSRIIVTVAVADECGLLVVADDGAGFPSNLLPHAFDRFARADSARGQVSGGAGLGLAIVASLTQAAGGTVSADNGPPLGGARVDVRVPLATEPGSHRDLINRCAE